MSLRLQYIINMDLMFKNVASLAPIIFKTQKLLLLVSIFENYIHLEYINLKALMLKILNLYIIYIREHQ